VFEELGIDYCCGGKRTLVDACAFRGLALDAVLERLTRAAGEGAAAGGVGSGDEAWNERPPAEIVGHVLARFHAGLREELARLEAMALRAAEKHGAANPELRATRDLVVRLRARLTAHLDGEEQCVFPALLTGASASARAALAAAEAEHVEIGELLASLRSATDGFQAPSNACNTWRGLYYGLADLERETHRHVHFEHAVLFPRAEVADCGCRC
jgi:regulator of cell morphogenesis and NO signaling